MRAAIQLALRKLSREADAADLFAEAHQTYFDFRVPHVLRRFFLGGVQEADDVFDGPHAIRKASSHRRRAAERTL